MLGRPEQPLGPDSLRRGGEGRFRFYNLPVRIDRLAYVVDWGDFCRETTAFRRIGDTVTLWHRWRDTGLFAVRCRAHNESGDTSLWSVPKFVRVWWIDSAPLAPEQVIGPAVVIRNAESLFGAVTTDPESDRLVYIFDWGEGDTQETWLYASGDTAWLLHSWQDTGTVLIRARARDEHGATGDWSPARPVRVLP